MRRPESHRTGELGEARAIQVFMEFGWIVTKLQPDYGFDLLVQRTESEQVVADFALVQVKATRRALRKEVAASISIQKRHLDLWKSVRIPTFLLFIALPNPDMFVIDCHALVGQFTSSAETAQPNRRRLFSIPEATRISAERMAALELAVQTFWSQLRKQFSAPDSSVSNRVALSALGVLSGALAIGSISGYLEGKTHKAEVLNLLRRELASGVGTELAEKIVREGLGSSILSTG